MARHHGKIEPDKGVLVFQMIEDKALSIDGRDSALSSISTRPARVLLVRSMASTALPSLAMTNALPVLRSKAEIAVSYATYSFREA